MEEVTSIKKRNPWIAGLFSFLLAGLGQIYNGQPAKGIIYFVFAQLVSFPPLVYMSAKGIISLKIIFSVLLASLIVESIIVIDAIIIARRLKAYKLKWFNRWYVYLAIIFIIGVPFLFIPTATLFPQSYKVPSESMEPQLLVGDYFFASGKVDNIQRGEVVVFYLDDNNGKMYVKRVIGLPGDHIIVTKSGEVILNGKPLLREGALHQPPSYLPSRPATLYMEHLDLSHYIISHDQDNEQQLTWDNTVPEGMLFVMGDHRTSSMDSRVFGPVEIEKIKGIAKVVYFSSSSRGKIRWDRIGLNLSNIAPQ